MERLGEEPTTPGVEPEAEGGVPVRVVIGAACLWGGVMKPVEPAMGLEGDAGAAAMDAGAAGVGAGEPEEAAAGAGGGV